MPALKNIKNGGVTSPKGYQSAGVKCGLKDDLYDLALLYSEKEAISAGVFTQNTFRAAPVMISEKRINGSVKAVVINSGNANACTGQQGLKDAKEMAAQTALGLGINEKEVLVASTGVIGVYLPMVKVKEGIKKAVSALSTDNGNLAAQAIMTTDTVPKEIALEGEINGKKFVIGGMAKGSGMICPNMATMLGFLTTDLIIESKLMQKALQNAVDRTFNMISVDGDTSTNDTVLILANGASGVNITSEDSPGYKVFYEALLKCCRELAVKIVADGEGATKLLHLKIKGVADFSSGKKMANSILNSLLVKTAFFGEDANWGRLITAMGYSGAPFSPEKVDVYIGDLQVAAKGAGLNFDEEEGKKILSKKDIYITIQLHQGDQDIEAWGCDLSYDYVRINGSYRS